MSLGLVVPDPAVARELPILSGNPLGERFPETEEVSHGTGGELLETSGRYRI
jgi:hypothetical protein